MSSNDVALALTIAASFFGLILLVLAIAWDKHSSKEDNKPKRG